MFWGFFCEADILIDLSGSAKWSGAYISLRSYIY